MFIAGLLSAVAASVIGASAAQADNGPEVQVLTTGQNDKTIEVYVGRSAALKADYKVKRVSVSDPKVADVQALAPDQVLVVGKTIGSTDLLIWSESEKVWRAHVAVVADLRELRARLAELLPGSELQLRQVDETVVITGRVRRVEHTAQIQKLLTAAGVKYVDMSSVCGVHQVMLQVRVAEASRNAIRALGINFFGTGNDFFGANQLGSSGGAAINPVNIGVRAGAPAAHGLPFVFLNNVNVSPGVTLFAGIPDADIQLFVQALTENQYMRILAEPNLVALSGERASFLAGGEFPIPVVQGGTGDSTAISVDYREFGVRLHFRPVVLGDNSINLHVAPEVSELSDVGGVQIQGFRIPTILTRRAETTVELRSGQTFAMAGLLSQHVTARNSRIPGLGDLPVIGALFRSVRYERGETELVVLITATLVEPASLASKRPVPGDFHVPPNDWEFFLEGRLEARRPPALSPVDAGYFREMGLHRLRGPGAWVSCGSPPARGRPDERPAEDPAGTQPAEGRSVQR